MRCCKIRLGSANGVHAAESDSCSRGRQTRCNKISRLHQRRTIAQKEILDNPFTPGLSKYGTAQLCVPMSTVGRFPTKNFQQGDFEFVEDIGADAIEGKYFVRRIACSACPIGCHHVVQVKDGKYAGSPNRVIE